MSETRTSIYLTRDLNQSLYVAHGLGAKAIGIDAEGVLGNFVGNGPYPGMIDDFLADPTRSAALAKLDVQGHPEKQYGVLTNNANMVTPRMVDDGNYGLITTLATRIGIPNVYHKGKVARSSNSDVLDKKPSGQMARQFCLDTTVAPADTVLIDDQGIKNTGEAVRAGLKAIIVPNPIGKMTPDGKIIEHPGVMRLRKVEPAIYRSLEHRGLLARLAYRIIANISIDQIGEFTDLRNEPGQIS